MRFIKFVAFLFYRYYSTGGTQRVPYFSTLCAMSMMIYIHLFQFLILINCVDAFIPGGDSEARPIKYLKLGLFFIPVFLILAILIKKKELEQMSYAKQVLKKGYVFLISYLIISFVVLIMLIIIFKKRQF